ncbi:Detected protein of confused Function [Hibiscus syriacus]|uniref:Detected protein of confused Function n=1 Tax=Hibiscus syriacus TaxID=106335 RepID=A0A6A3ADK5_HIBSY|nr:Detected protein of confused Function [Hibiscus syriacus]
MEQDVEKFIRDPTQQQFEFQQLPTSYLRLAAHRIAQHYSLQSMASSDRLADIPVNLPSEDPGVVKVAIKQRPTEKWKTSSEPRLQDASYMVPQGCQMEEKSVSMVSDVNSGSGLIDYSSSSSRSARIRTEEEPIGRSKHIIGWPSFGIMKLSARILIMTGTTIGTCKDLILGLDSIVDHTQCNLCTPTINYNTEFPQLGYTHRPQISTEHQPRPLRQHIPGPWVAPPTAAGISYGHPETMMPPFNPHVGSRSIYHICILLSILFSVLECHSSTLMSMSAGIKTGVSGHGSEGICIDPLPHSVYLGASVALAKVEEAHLVWHIFIAIDDDDDEEK